MYNNRYVTELSISEVKEYYEMLRENRKLTHEWNEDFGICKERLIEYACKNIDKAESLRGGINMAYVELQYEGKEPCCRCVHKKICEATRCLDEIRYTVRHLKYPIFNVKVECTEFYKEEQECQI